MIMDVKQVTFLLTFFVSIHQSFSSFWNEIPRNCIYDQKTTFSCWNTTFIHPIPLFNDRVYTLQDHRVHIQNSFFQLSIRDLLIHVGTNIQSLTLTNNTFASNVIDVNNIFEGGIFFRLLSNLSVHDSLALQWAQLNGSYFPRLTHLDLSNNQLTIRTRLSFDRRFYPKLKSIDLSSNKLSSIENLVGNALQTLEILILSHNPLEQIDRQLLKQFSSLQILDLSSTSIKHLFSQTFLPNLQTLICQHCRQIPSWEYKKFFANCSSKLTIDLTYSNVYSLKVFNSHSHCLKDLILNEQNLVESINTNDLLDSIYLETIQARKNYDLENVYLNVYEHLTSIDFSDNIYLNQVLLRLRSNDTHIQQLNLAHTGLTDFSIDFANTTLKYIHIDRVDMSSSHLETIEFLKYLTFHTIDLSSNRLKIIDLSLITYRHGMYDLSLMNSLNLSSNQMEYLKLNYENESPHTIDLSNNQLETIDLSGQTTYTLLLNQNSKLSLAQPNFHVDIPSLQYLDVSSINLHSLEHLIYLHNLTNLHTLSLSHNRLEIGHRILNWHLFEPWKKTLTHATLQNLSLEQIDAGAQLTDYYHLLTVDLNLNIHLQCDCRLQPFLDWLRVPAPALNDFYEPLQKFLRIDCPISLYDLHCDDEYREQKNHNIASFFKFLFGLFSLIVILLLIFKFIDRKIRRLQSRFYQRVYTDADIITLNERHITHRTVDDNDDDVA